MGTKVTDSQQVNIGKLESQVRYATEQQTYQQSEIMGRLKNLEDQIAISDSMRNELRDKLKGAEESNRDLAAFIRSLQSQGNTEMSSMREFLQQKNSEDQSTVQKSNEKSSILFGEMVRLGK